MQSDDRTVHVQIEATMSADQLQNFLQMIRDFDMKNEALIDFRINMVTPLSADEVKAIYASIKPPFAFSGMITPDGKLHEDPERKADG